MKTQTSYPNIIASTHTPKIFVNSFVIEITRKCNFNCPHCLRGPAENLDINLSLLHKIAKTIIPNTITFTGGEPALNLSAIESYIKFAESENTLPSSFFIATNGSVNQLDLAILALKLYQKMEDKEYCAISISKDQFHEDFLDGDAEEEAEILKGLKFYSTMKEHQDNTYDADWILPTGNAALNGLGLQNVKMIEKGSDKLYVESYYNDKQELVYQIDQMFISSKGFITNSCDLSYEEVDRNHLCTIDTLHEYLDANYKYDEDDDYETVKD